jgi:hypothetical protein
VIYDRDLIGDREFRALSARWDRLINASIQGLIITGATESDRREIHQASSELALIAFAQAFTALIENGGPGDIGPVPAPEEIDSLTIALLEQTIARIKRTRTLS